MKAIIEPTDTNKVTLTTNNGNTKVSIQNGIVSVENFIKESASCPINICAEWEDIPLEDANIDESTLEKAAWHQIQQTGKEFELVYWKGEGFYQVLPNGKMKFATKNRELAAEANADGITNYFVAKKYLA